MPTGAGTGAGPFHSQSNEAWFTKTPGLKIAYPAFPDDAKGLLIQSFEDPNPVLFFGTQKLYRSLKGNVPEGFYTTHSGKPESKRRRGTYDYYLRFRSSHCFRICRKNPEISLKLLI